MTDLFRNTISIEKVFSTNKNVMNLKIYFYNLFVQNSKYKSRSFDFDKWSSYKFKKRTLFQN